jgi:WD40 repeat protein
VQDADEASGGEITLRQSPPTHGSSIIGQIPYSFPRSQRNALPPFLDPLGPTEKVSDRDVSDRPDVWPQSAPYRKSPPAGPVHDTSANNGSTTDQQIKGGFTTKSPPVSPPQRNVRPVSYGSTVRPVSARKSSNDIGHRHTASAYASSPPLPHLPQPHFYRAPDIDLGLGSRFREPSVDPAASFVGFGHLPCGIINAWTSRTKLMLLGSESRLDILTVNKKTASPIGALKQLAGQVIDAAFLTWESGKDPFHHLRPLVVVTIHGPKVTEDQTADQDDSDALEHSDILPAIHAPSMAANEVNDEFQTRVEVYSLVDRKRVATLFKARPVPMQPSIRGYPRSPPPPTGDLRLDVGGNFVTVSSGTSGEVWAFGVQSSNFRCLGKFWTTVQAYEVRRSSSSGGYLDRDISPADLEASRRPSEHPIVALSSRWLAICPAGRVSRPTLAGSIPPSLAAARVPGLDSYTAPPRPSETCILDSPDAPSLLNRVARGVAQEVVKGARWLGDQSLQTWNNYWRKDQHPQSPQTSPYNQPGYSPDQHPNFFPPTHAQETRSASEPELVSIIDLKRLQDGPSKKGIDPLAPLATFQPPGGCSFVSFAPNGLNLLTASRKGDVQYVWDLMQVKNCRAAAFITTQSDAPQSVSPEVSPRVRQVAKFPRLTSSSVVDVAWSPPVGDRLAVITRNGTVHIFDLPSSAFQWPPLRRGPRTGPVSAPASPAVNPQREEIGTAGGVLASAMRLAGKTQPMLANLRGRAPSVGGGVSGISTNSIGFASVAGVRSGKAVAAGLSQSLEAAAGTVNTLRHAGDSRVHLSNMAKDPARARVVWGQASVLIVDGMAISTYRVRRAQATGKGRQKVTVVDANSATSTKLPKLAELASISTEKQRGQSEGLEERMDGTVSCYWTSRPTAPKLLLEDSHPLSRAEIETNAPYQPFHSDRRVNLFVHSSGIALSESQIPTASVIFHGAYTPLTPEKWVFGNELPATKLNLRSSTYDTFDECGEGDPAAQIYRQTTTEGDGENEQIVSTTKPRKGKRGNASASMLGGNGGLEDAEELDFEDDVEFLDYATDRV